MNKTAVSIPLLLFACLFFSCAASVPGTGVGGQAEVLSGQEMSFNAGGAKSGKEKERFYEKSADALFAKGDYEAAAQIYNKLLEENPPKKKKARYYVKLGDAEAAKKSYNKGLEYYKNALVLYKNDNEIRRKIGDILLESNLYGLAEQSFLDILSSDKNSDYAKKKLGDIYYKQKKYSKALSYYEGVNSSYYDKDMITAMAVCYRSLSNTDKALKLTQEFINVSPSSEMYFLSGLLLLDSGDFDKAEKMLLRSVNLDASNFSSYIYLSAVYLEKDDIDKAQEMLKKANTINSYTAAADIMSARIAYKKGKIYEARRYASSAVLKSKTPFVKRQAEKMAAFLNKSKIR